MKRIGCIKASTGLVVLTVSMATTLPPSGLLALPRELRDVIWTSAVSYPVVAVTPNMQQRTGSTMQGSAIQPGLCRVNRQLREESLSLFYENNTFALDFGWHEHTATIKRWLSAIGNHNIRLLHSLSAEAGTLSMLHRGGRGWMMYLINGRFNFQADTFEFEAYMQLKGDMELLVEHEDVERLRKSEDTFRGVLGERRLIGLDHDGIIWLMEAFNDFCRSRDNPLVRD